MKTSMTGQNASDFFSCVGAAYEELFASFPNHNRVTLAVTITQIGRAHV